MEVFLNQFINTTPRVKLLGMGPLRFSKIDLCTIFTRPFHLLVMAKFSYSWKGLVKVMTFQPHLLHLKGTHNQSHGFQTKIIKIELSI